MSGFINNKTADALAEMIKRLLPKSEFKKNIANVAGGTFISQALTLAMAPLLTRLFSPDDFGLLYIFNTLVVFLAIGSTFRYELAVMLPQEEEEAMNVVSLSLIITLCYSLIIFLVFQLGGKLIFHFLNAGSILSYIPFTSLYIFCFGVMNTLNYWLSRKKNFIQLSSGKVIQSGVTGIGSIILFFVGYKHGGLIAGSVLGQLSVGVLYLFFFRKDWLRLKFVVSRRRMNEMFNRYIHFLKFNTPHAFIDASQDLIIAAIILHYFGSVPAGLYYLCYRVLKLPTGLIGTATGQVFFQRANEIFSDRKTIQAEIRKLYKQLLFLSVPIFGIIIIAGPFLFGFIFGKQWSEAGTYSRLLVPSLMFGFILNPVSFLPVIAKMQHYAIVFGIIDLALRTGGLLLGVYYHSIYIGLACMSIGSALLYAYLMYWYYMLPVNKEVKQY